MNLNTVNLILWAPFGVVGLLAALIYCIKGIRKGVKPALVSLAAIFAATGIGILLARTLAGVLAPALQGMIPPEAFADMGAAGSMMELLVLSVISTLAALVLFMGLFFLLTPILGAAGKAVLGRYTEPAEVTGGDRVGGAAIGLVTAFLYALVFLLPVYGSLAAYAPLVRSALDVLPMEDTTLEARTPTVQRLGTNTLPVNKTAAPAAYSDQQLLRDILDCILQHPLVEVSASAPVQQVYSSLSQVRHDQAPVNFADMAVTMEQLMTRVTAVTQAPEEQKPALGRELVEFCRTQVLDQDWAYAVYAMAMEQLPNMLPESGEPAMDALVAEAAEILAVNQHEFRDNAEAMLDFALVALDQKALAFFEEPSYGALQASGLLPAAGRLINGTEQLVQIKELGYRTFMEMAGEEKGAQTRAFAEKYPLGPITDPALQQQEAEAFCVLMGMNEQLQPVEFFRLHPSLGESRYQEFCAIMGMR